MNTPTKAMIRGLLLTSALMIVPPRTYACQDQESATPEVQASSIEHGRQLFEKLACNSCHTPEKNPLLALSLYSNEELRALIESPASDLMPQFKLKDKDACDLSRFLRRNFE